MTRQVFVGVLIGIIGFLLGALIGLFFLSSSSSSSSAPNKIIEEQRRLAEEQQQQQREQEDQDSLHQVNGRRLRFKKNPSSSDKKNDQRQKNKPVRNAFVGYMDRMHNSGQEVRWMYYSAYGSNVQGDILLIGHPEVGLHVPPFCSVLRGSDVTYENAKLVLENQPCGAGASTVWHHIKPMAKYFADRNLSSDALSTALGASRKHQKQKRKKPKRKSSPSPSSSPSSSGSKTVTSSSSNNKSSANQQGQKNSPQQKQHKTVEEGDEEEEEDEPQQETAPCQVRCLILIDEQDDPDAVRLFYPFLRSLYMPHHPVLRRLLLHDYDYVLKTDLDIFFTPNFNKLRPPPGRLYAGTGKYAHTEGLKRRLRNIAKNLSMTHRGIHNIGAAFYGESKLVLEVTELARSVTIYILETSYGDDCKPGKQMTCVGKNPGRWPDWWRGVTSMYGNEIAMNHKAPNFISGALDSPCDNRFKTCQGIASVSHAWHCCSKDHPFNKFEMQYYIRHEAKFFEAEKKVSGWLKYSGNYALHIALKVRHEIRPAKPWGRSVCDKP